METHTSRLTITGVMTDQYHEVLTPGAMAFIEKLEMRFGEQRKQLLRKRQERQKEIDLGKRPDFLSETEHIRNSDWIVAPLPNDLIDRRVEITGPVDRKMVINALNSGAKVFMADFEDATSPTWKNVIEGQLNLRDAVKRSITFVNPNGKEYRLNDEVATMVVRPRGWHLEEKHILLDHRRISASLMDFGLYFYHNVKTLLSNGSGPYFYLPKIENHLEARLWNDVFVFAQNELNVKQGTIKATVLIETILATFEVDEILYELREHSAGLNCGRWYYIFSYLKRLRNCENIILPDRSQVTMTVPFMSAYSQLVVKTCHRRNVHAIGGMAAQIPIKNNPEANDEAFCKVRADKEREAQNGHDGTWVAHPGLVPVAMEAFNKVMLGQNQIDRKREDFNTSPQELLQVPEGTITEKGVRTNINVGIQYIESWLCGRGAAPIHHLMEDAATAEISRAQLWQWIRHPKGVLEDGRKITLELVRQLKEEELTVIKDEVGHQAFTEGRFIEATELFDWLIESDTFEEFLTLAGYEYL